MESQTSAIESLPKGEFIRRIIAGKETQKVYQYAGYCRLNKRYQLDDTDDCSRAIYVKKGTIVSHGFTY